jgi:propanol-preferring alcohol dehydrogenase
MKAMVLHQPKPVVHDPLEEEDVEIPRPGRGQIRLRVRVCGVCHTDLHTVEGELELPRLPVIPGHQIVGAVDALGEESRHYQIGDRVGVGWLNETCGRCEYCRQGLENLCPYARFTGLHVDGGYAQYMIVPEGFAFPLPEDIDDAHSAPLLCAGIIGYRSLRLSGIQPGGRLGLYGFGGSAHLVIQVARHWGCAVYVFTRSADHRRHAEELGAVWTGEAQDKPPVLLDASITFAPAGWIIPLALDHLRPGGTLAINAIHMSPIPEIPYRLLYGERVLRSATNFTRQDVEEFLWLAGKIPLHTDVEQYPLSEANLALQRMKASVIQGAAVLEV